MPQKESFDTSTKFSVSRAEIIANKRRSQVRNRPFIVLAVLFLIIITFIPVIYYVKTHITPYNTKKQTQCALLCTDTPYKEAFSWYILFPGSHCW